VRAELLVLAVTEVEEHTQAATRADVASLTAEARAHREELLSATRLCEARRGWETPPNFCLG
jgi:hypothetical protein